MDANNFNWSKWFTSTLPKRLSLPPAAQWRVLVKRALRKYGIPPDKREKAAETVLAQAGLLSGDRAGA
jgi:hypothetical protein